MSMTVARFLSRGAAHRARAARCPRGCSASSPCVAFAFLLGVTWSFRGTAQKYAPPGHGAAAPAAAAAAKPAQAADDEAHWPEHPGHGHP